MNTFTYTAAKNMINKKLYKSSEQMEQMLQVFAMSGDITAEQYQELHELLGAQA